MNKQIIKRALTQYNYTYSRKGQIGKAQGARAMTSTTLCMGTANPNPKNIGCKNQVGFSFANRTANRTDAKFPWKTRAIHPDKTLAKGREQRALWKRENVPPCSSAQTKIRKVA